MNCVECGEQMISDWRWRESEHAGQRRHAGRGLCHGCRHRARRAGTIENYPRVSTAMSRQELIEEVQFLVDGGTRNLVTIAHEIGVKRDTLTLALRRAARGGDEQAIAIRNRLIGLRT